MGISVIVPTYNNQNYLKECIESIYRSGIDRDYELLIGIDQCEKTLDYIRTLQIDDKTKIFFFLKNGGPYIIKNTLAQMAKHDNILFFDSDDVMEPQMIPVSEDGLTKFSIVRPKMRNFRIINNKKVLDNNNKKWGEGVFAIKKDLFLGLNGFEGWRVAADSDFLGRLIKNRAKMWSTNEPLFLRRVHATSLTMSIDTGFKSELRMKLAKISKEKKYFGPLPNLVTGEYTEIFLENVESLNLKKLMKANQETEEMENYRKTKRLVAEILSNENISPKITNSHKLDYNRINQQQINRQNNTNKTNEALKKIQGFAKLVPVSGKKIIR